MRGSFVASALWLGARLPPAALFCLAGSGHFREPQKFIGIMEGMWWPQLHPAAVYLTGIAELALSLALALAPSARVARWLIYLVLAMSPANLNMWRGDVPFGEARLTYGWTGTHALRGVLQILLLLWLRRLEVCMRDAPQMKALSA